MMTQRLAIVVLAAGLMACGASAKTAAPKAAPPAAPAPPEAAKPPLVEQDGAEVKFPRYGFRWTIPDPTWEGKVSEAEIGSGDPQIMLSRDDLQAIVQFTLFSAQGAEPALVAENLKGTVDPVAAQISIGPTETSADGNRAAFTVESTDPQNVFKDRILVVRLLGPQDPLVAIVMLRAFIPQNFDAAVADLTALLDSVQPL